MSLLIPDAPTLFTQRRLIDGNGGKPVENAAVKVEGNLITAVGTTARLRREPERQPCASSTSRARRSCPA